MGYVGKINSGGSTHLVGSTLYGTCNTAANVAEKAVTLPDFDELITGITIHVKFTNSNTATSPELNVNSVESKPIYRYGTTVPGTSVQTSWMAGAVVSFTYDGTGWIQNDWLNNNDNTVSQVHCTTAAGTSAKVGTCTGYVLLAKSYCMVNLTAANSSQSALTLNVNGKGAKPIYINGTASSASNYTLPAGSYLVYYDGTAYYFRTDGKITGSITGDAATVNGHTVTGDLGSAAYKNINVANGVAGLDSQGKVAAAQLPSYVDDVLEFPQKANFPIEGESGKIYVDQSTNKTWRWGGSAYVEISPSLALGTTSSTAYRGDYGAAAYKHGVTNKGSEFSSNLYKITTNSEGHVIAATPVTATDIAALGIDISDTTYDIVTDSIGSASKGTNIAADDITAWSAGTLPTLGTAIAADDITAWSAGTVPTLGTAIPADDITAWSAGTAASASVSNGTLTITNGTAPSLSYTAKSIPNVTNVGTAPSLTYTARSIPNVTGVGTLPSLTYTARSIPNISVTPVTVVTALTPQ